MLSPQTTAGQTVRPLSRVYESKVRLCFGAQLCVVGHFSPAYRAFAVEVNLGSSCLEPRHWIAQETRQCAADIRIPEPETQRSGSIRRDALSVYEQLRHFTQCDSQHDRRNSQPQWTAEGIGNPTLEFQ